jgi:hypothetical protein
MNMVQKSVYTCKQMKKMIPVETTPGIRGGSGEGEWLRI